MKLRVLLAELAVKPEYSDFFIYLEDFIEELIILFYEDLKSSKS